MITSENYFSPENNLKYMGSSQFKSFMECEAAAIAKLKGEWQEETSVALLVGSYVDSHFEGTLDVFKAKNPEIFTRNGELKSDYRHAEYIINRIERDEMFMRYMNGGKQKILSGDIDGVPFKIKIDSYHIGKAIVDLKVVKDFNPVWTQGQGKLSFVEAWGYDIQAAIYQAVEGNNLPFFIAAATKEKPEPDIAIISIPQERIDVALDIVREYAPRFDELKRNIGEPKRCEKCSYCKATKVLTEIISFEEL